jgi:hypothetical protein
VMPRPATNCTAQKCGDSSAVFAQAGGGEGEEKRLQSLVFSLALQWEMGHNQIIGKREESFRIVDGNLYSFLFFVFLFSGYCLGRSMQYRAVQ